MTSNSIPNKPLRLAMLGMVDGNGHPYSWSAILNGYDREKMAKCPYPGIADYLGRQPPETFGIAGARVTHVWTDDPADAVQVAAASLVPHVVEHPEDVIGQVDAVLIATDKGGEHVDRCRPFVEAGLPIFVDKPMVDNEEDLRTFCRWVESGARILSSSALRYAKEFMPYRASTAELGAIRFASITTAKSWERYGIHAIEGIYPILGPGFISARNTGSLDRNVVHFKHACGADVMVVANYDMFGGFGCLQLCGTIAGAQLAMRDTYYAFKAQLETFVEYVTTGVRPFPFEETVETMQMVIAGIMSRESGGREVALSEIHF
jgi:predicted dehydrogenase